MHKIGKMLSFIEENYIKSIYKIAEASGGPVSTNSLAEKMGIKAATVTDMLRKLSDKSFIHYQKYQGVTLSEKGNNRALQIIRKHRLWEMFLVQKLNFGWDEVHEVAEQLEHIQSEKLIHELDRFLDYPAIDPHGEPIPTASLEMNREPVWYLFNFRKADILTVVGVSDDSALFLNMLDSLAISLGSVIEILECNEYDNSFLIKLNNKATVLISQKVAQNLIVQPNNDRK